MPSYIKNLFTLPDLNNSQEELHSQLLNTPHLTLERIVSTGQASPPGEWYDQTRDEWVMVLKGSAGLRFAEDQQILTLFPGDYLHIPAHQRHRVEWTDSQEPTIWLALHHDPTH